MKRTNDPTAAIKGELERQRLILAQILSEIKTRFQDLKYSEIQELKTKASRIKARAEELEKLLNGQ